MRLLRKYDGIPQTLLKGNSIGDYLRRRCPRQARPTSGPVEFVVMAGMLPDSVAYAYRLAFAELARRCAQAEREHGIAGIEDRPARACRGNVAARLPREVSGRSAIRPRTLFQPIFFTGEMAMECGLPGVAKLGTLLAKLLLKASFHPLGERS